MAIPMSDGPQPAMVDVVRMVPIGTAALETRTDDGDEAGRRLVGYAAVFNQWAEINSFWEGHFLERLDPAAFTKTIAERGDQIKVLYDHGFDPSIGNKPLGKPDIMMPDARGLWTETPLARTSYNDDLLELLRVGAIDGMSFRFQVIRDEWNDEPSPSDVNPKGIPERTIKELRMFEFGPVTFPAYEATTAGVRGGPAYQAWRQHRSSQRVPDDAAERTSSKDNGDTPPEGHLSRAERERAAAERRALIASIRKDQSS